jgi:hypothetical protein
VSDQTERSDEVPESMTTGHADVDAVLGSLEGLEDRPVIEHVAVFEAAHESLRAALADADGRADAPAGR